MSLNLEIPLVRTTRNEMDQGQVGGMQIGELMQATGKRLPDVDKNYAENESVVKQINELINPTVNFCRTDRQTLESEWRAIMRMEWMVHDEGQRYKGSSNSYLPIFARIHNTLVSSLSRGLFPSDEYMDVIDRQSITGSDQAKAVKTYLQWEFERVGEVRKKIKPFLRTLSAFGNAPLKFWYDKAPKVQGRRGSRSAGGVDMTPQFTSMASCEGLRVSPRNLFHWYIWPYTAEGIEDATLVFEDITVPLPMIEGKVNRGEYLNGQAAMNAATPATQHTTEVVRMTQLLGLTAPQGSSVQGNGLGGVRVLTEAWTFLVLPREAYVEGEDPSEPVPVKIVLAGQIPVEVRRNPFFHQRPPYLFSRLNAQSALVYGYGNGRLARPMQYLANDFANQTADIGAYGLNPITIVNPAYLAGPLRPISPGVTWYMTDVDKGVQFRSPDWELVGKGQEMMNMYLTMAQDLSGAPPILQGGGGGGANTATGTQILQNNAMQPLQDVVEDIELDVLVPLMFGTWLNAQQYRDKAVMAQIGSMPQPMNIPPEMLIMDPEFRWMASSQAANQAQRAQQLLNLIAAGVQAQPAFNAAGFIFNPKSLLERTVVDGFGQRLPPDLFLPIGQPAAPGQPPSPGVMDAQRNAVGSAVEQANGQDPYNVQMAPGEGEAMGQVQQTSDQLAATMGGNNGKG